MKHKRHVRIKKDKIEVKKETMFSEVTAEDIKQASWRTECKIMTRPNVVTFFEMEEKE